MKIAITGAHGFIGSHLVPSLRANKHDVVRIVRSHADDSDISWDPQAETIDTDALEAAQLDAVVHLAGEGIATKRWSVGQKEKILNSRVKGTGLLARSLANLSHKPSIFLSSSAIGYYGNRGSDFLNEDDSCGTDFLAQVCRQWEDAAKPADDAGIATAIIRTGNVLSADGGLLKRFLTPFKFGLGGRLGKGTQYMSWITLEDHIRAMTFLIENKHAGIYNLTAPAPVTNREFTKALAHQLSRPAIVPVPILPLKLMFGSEIVNHVIMSSARVAPAALKSKGFTFNHNNINDALESIL